MKNFLRLLSLILLLSISTCALWAQNQQDAGDTSFDDIFDLILNYLGNDDSGDDLDVTDLRDNLLQIYTNPYNWNGITRQQLEELYFVDDATIQELLYYSEQLGTVHSIGELQLVENIDKALLYLLPSFIYVAEIDHEKRWADCFDNTKHRVVVRFDNTPELRSGFIADEETGEKKYLGNNFKILAKYQLTAGDNFRCGVALESDYGEPFFGEYGQGFDLYRAYAEVNNLGVVQRGVVGAFRAGYGDGLIMGMQSYGSSLTKLLSPSSQTGVRGYGGVSEYPTLQGVASNLKVGKISLSVLYGFISLDADTTGGVWSSYSTDGYHRTISDLERRNTLYMHTVAANLGYNINRFDFGLTTYSGFFSLPSVGGTTDWAVYDFMGKNQFASSLDYSYNSRSIRFSGETAISYYSSNNNSPIGVATTNTLQFYLLSDTQFSLNYRYFSNNYHAFWANTSSSQSTVNGEHGISSALCFPITSNISFQGYANVYKSLWGSIYTPNDKISYELRSEINIFFNRNSTLLLYLRHRESPSWQTNLDLSHTNLAVKERITSFNCKFTNKLGVVNLITNIQANYASAYELEDYADTETILDGGWSSASFGYLIAQDVNYTSRSLPLSLRSRIAFYGAPEYSNRFYLNESDVPESGYSSSLYGSAMRWYILASYKIQRAVSLAFRISQTLYSDRETIGSSYDQIDSWHRTDMHFYISLDI